MAKEAVQRNLVDEVPTVKVVQDVQIDVLHVFPDGVEATIVDKLVNIDSLVFVDYKI